MILLDFTVEEIEAEEIEEEVAAIEEKEDLEEEEDSEETNLWFNHLKIFIINFYYFIINIK